MAHQRTTTKIHVRGSIRSNRESLGQPSIEKTVEPLRAFFLEKAICRLARL